MKHIIRTDSTLIFCSYAQYIAGRKGSSYYQRNQIQREKKVQALSRVRKKIFSIAALGIITAASMCHSSVKDLSVRLVSLSR